MPTTPLKEVLVPLSHKDDWLSHGPGRGNWWAVFEKPDLAAGEEFHFHFLHDSRYRSHIHCRCTGLRKLTGEESAAIGATLGNHWKIEYEVLQPEDPPDLGDGQDPIEQGRQIRAEEEKRRLTT